MSYSNGYIVGFAAGICVFCSIFVAGSAVALKEKQKENQVVDRQRNVLSVSGLTPDAAALSNAEVQAIFSEKITPKLVDLATGAPVADGTKVPCPTGEVTLDAKTYNQQTAKSDPCLGQDAPPNDAKLLRMPKYGLVYEVVDSGQVKAIILPVEGKGLWSTLYGYVSLESDAETVKGLTFYQHAETPGLGGEVDNPKWKGQWPGKQIHDAQGEVALQVMKGRSKDPKHQVDGLSGATLTSRGVTYLVQFWLGDQGFGPYLKTYRKGA